MAIKICKPGTWYVQQAASIMPDVFFVHGQRYMGRSSQIAKKTHQYYNPQV